MIVTFFRGASIVPKLLLSSLAAKTNGQTKMKIAAPPIFDASEMYSFGAFVSIKIINAFFSQSIENVESSSSSQSMQTLATATVAFRRLNTN